MKIIFLTLFSILLFANDNLTNYLTDYRLNGIDNVEKKMDLQLSKKEYWDNYLKNIDTTFGYIEKYSSVLTCNKDKSTLNLYKKNNKHKFKLEKKFSAYTGKKKGDKLTEGDLRTPIGIYDITKKITKIDAFYGPLAFVTSYPNLYDTYKGKDGHGIWIHGLPTDQERDEFTKGCIAINNSSLKSLDKKIEIDTTLLIINSSKVDKNISKKKLSSILSQIYMWRYSWIYSDINKYLSFYSNNFVREDGMNFDRFKRYKTRIFKKNEKKKIIFKNLNVIKYPNTKNIYQVTFQEIYNSNSFSFKGNKVLIITLDKKNRLKIFTEK